jgi:hypothetical protein
VLSIKPCEVEDEPLYLPSQLTHEQRLAFRLERVAALEAELRDGQALDSILQLRRLEKVLSAKQGLRKKNDRGQHQNTRARGKIQRTTFVRDAVLIAYSNCRLALESLLQGDEAQLSAFRKRYPSLSKADLHRKSTVDKRQLGDSYRSEGALWTLQNFGGTTSTVGE